MNNVNPAIGDITDVLSRKANYAQENLKRKRNEKKLKSYGNKEENRK